MPDDKARRNLTKALSALRRVVEPYLVFEQQVVAFNAAAPYRLDVAQFEAAAAAESAALYRGDFPEGFLSATRRSLRNGCWSNASGCARWRCASSAWAPTPRPKPTGGKAWRLTRRSAIRAARLSTRVSWGGGAWCVGGDRLPEAIAQHEAALAVHRALGSRDWQAMAQHLANTQPELDVTRGPEV
jgi:hypothetical protein